MSVYYSALTTVASINWMIITELWYLRNDHILVLSLYYSAVIESATLSGSGWLRYGDLDCKPSFRASKQHENKAPDTESGVDIY